eukprot:TRINITY_DN9924_c0_g1_i1.p1 TRINITY_DN9924_c0_g1~~TRINITY_DN9924_c0_g1_i1.p1  ORF type:complete len:415 (-),score=83.47 TRINITY_DN9924_c0_g1_i1:59-1303(-)
MTSRALRAKLADLASIIDNNGKVLRREAKMAASNKSKVVTNGDATPWGATLLIKEESALPHKGFELWLGSVDDAINIDAMRDRRVTAMVNMSVTECKAEQKTRLNMGHRHAAFNGREDLAWKKVSFSADFYSRGLSADDFWYLALDTEDHFDYPLSEKFDEVAEFLNACRLDGRKVLVHCIMGMNRSAFACAAFLMRMGLARGEDGLDVRAAVHHVSSRRLDVMKNPSFLKQLIAYGQKGSGGGQSSSSSQIRAKTPCLLALSSVHRPPVAAVFPPRRPSASASRLGTPAPYKTPVKLSDTQLKMSPLCPSTEAVARIIVRNPAEHPMRPRRLSLGASFDANEEAQGLDAALSSTLRGNGSEWKVSNSRMTALRSRSTGCVGYSGAGPRRALAMHCESRKRSGAGGASTAVACA